MGAPYPATPCHLYSAGNSEKFPAEYKLLWQGLPGKGKILQFTKRPSQAKTSAISAVKYCNQTGCPPMFLLLFLSYLHRKTQQH